jgi:biopolymer transport protein ExbD
MVDVVMVILIFFMLGTTFAVSEGILPTQLPSRIGPGGGAAVSIVPVVHIRLRTEFDGKFCKITVMEHALSSRSFEVLCAFMTERLEAGADPEGPILIAAEPDVKYQDVISAMDACVRAGFSNIQFSVGDRTTQAEIDERTTP